jgi:transposase
MQKKAHVEGRTLVFVDEPGVSLLPGHGRTYAPCRQPPVLRWPSTRNHLSVMSGITMAGRLSTMVRDEAPDSRESVVFLKHLLPHVSDILLVVWDGSPMHRGHVRACLAAGGAQQIHVEQLPAYAPDLNPAEGIWQQFTNVEMRHLCCRNLACLRSELDLAIRRLRRNPLSLLRVLPEQGYPSKIKFCMQHSVEQAIATNRAFAKAYRALGSLYEQKKHYQQARTVYGRGLQYAPDDPVLLNNLSWVHLMPGGDAATAYLYVHKAASLAPEDPDLQDTLAWWCYLTHDYLRAITILKAVSSRSICHEAPPPRHPADLRALHRCGHGIRTGQYYRGGCRQRFKRQATDISSRASGCHCYPHHLFVPDSRRGMGKRRAQRGWSASG